MTHDNATNMGAGIGIPLAMLVNYLLERVAGIDLPSEIEAAISAILVWLVVVITPPKKQ